MDPKKIKMKVEKKTKTKTKCRAGEERKKKRRTKTKNKTSSGSNWSCLHKSAAFFSNCSLVSMGFIRTSPTLLTTSTNPSVNSFRDTLISSLLRGKGYNKRVIKRKQKKKKSRQT